MATESTDHRARLAAAVEAMQKQQARIQQLERAVASTHEPIAIVGIGCRFPGGVVDAASFWQRLDEGFDAITEIPVERFPIDGLHDANPDAAGRISTRYGGFLDRIDSFDARFFQISPREAQTMDPQQRLLLEVTWQAFEHAGIPPASLVGSATGVFVGLTAVDYARVISRDDLSRIDAYCATGNVANIAAGRLSYVFGLRGPSVALDTACSSSLVSLHLACQSLRTGESELAIAAGVNLMITPDNFVAVSRAHMLSPDGRCKAFDKSANGYGRSEGCGVLLLKRLSNARAAGDRVLAVILGSAVRQDGQRSGLTVPNGPAQGAVMRAALGSARVAPHQVGYLEAHGTGTSLGDPIEFEALSAVYGQGRERSQPLIVGSLKTNLGHMESAAGVGGVIKTALSVAHGMIPRHLHFSEPNPEIDLAVAPAAIPASTTAWPSGYARHIGAVSSFGSSGTIAHVIVAAPDAADRATSPASPGRPHVLPISAKTKRALTELEAAYARQLADVTEEDASNVCYTAAVGRSHFSHRVAVVGRSAAELAERIRRGDVFASGNEPSDTDRSANVLEAERLARDYVAGADIDWAVVARGWGRRVDVPTYPFQPDRHWVDQPATVRASGGTRRAVAPVGGGLRFGVMFFNGTETTDGSDSYRLLLETTRYADAHGFSSVWLPERHFTAFGSLYPNPSVVHAALARETRQLRLMAGSVVLPLHNPIRIAEEWAVVDNLSGGRVGISFASGWNPDDFVLNPSQYAERKEEVFRGIETLRRLWRGEPLQARNALGVEVSVRTLPTPIQRELPVWVTAAASPETFRRAGEIGANLLTHLLDHDVDELSGKIGIYRAARAAHGHDPAAGQVTVMLHTFVGASMDYVHSRVREPYCRFLKENAGLLKGLAANRGSGADISSLGEDDLDGFVAFLYQRFSATRALLGTVDSCLTLVDQLEAIGVNEIACLLDFGPSTDDVLGQLPMLEELMTRAVDPGRLRAPIANALDSRAGAATTTKLTGVAYEIGWRDAQVPARRDGVPGTAWAVVDSGTPAGRALAGRLAASGIRNVTLDAARLDADDADSVAEALVSTGCREAFCTWHTEIPDDDSEAIARSLLRVARLVKALSTRGSDRVPRLWFITRHGYPAMLGDTAAARSASQAALWGLVKVLPIEQLAVWGGVIDLDPADASYQDIDRVSDVVRHEVREDQIALRGRLAFAARLAPTVDPAPVSDEDEWRCRVDAAYLVTGGFGGIGLAGARWLFDKGARRLVLLGRSGPADSSAVAALEAAGAHVESVRLDIADRAAFVRWLEERRGSGAPPIAGVLHAAGAWHDGAVADLDAGTLGRVLAPKLDGMLTLEAAFAPGSLDFFVAFSAFSALLAAQGQGNYAAANAFMDARIDARRAHGERAISVNWGPWSDLGFATTDYGRRAHASLQSLGIGRLTPDQGWTILDRLLAANRSSVGVMPVDWATLFRADPNARLSPLLGELAVAWAGAANQHMQEAGQLLASLQNLRSDEQLATLRTALTSIVVDIMRVDAREVDPRTPLTDLGLDSLMAVEIKNRLQHDTGVGLPLVQLLQGPSVEELAANVLAEIKLSQLTPGANVEGSALEEIEL